MGWKSLRDYSCAGVEKESGLGVVPGEKTNSLKCSELFY